MSKVWLITGSSRGLGRALAEAVLAEGHKVVATALTPRSSPIWWSATGIRFAPSPST
jgi:NAD(P)-dependent dehydrogenase (short-subunit alcohol dehydrogenase family)